jgi:sulfite oxidase
MNDVFYVRQHLPRPKVDTATYRLSIGGLVGKETVLTLADLRRLPATKVIATLECAGNGRAFYRPRVAGVQWGRGAIGNAEWSGPRISEVLKLAGATPDAAFLNTNGADRGLLKTPDFVRSLPMTKALHPATILALDMNGTPIPDLHGSPARLIVPGWDGTSWVKWVTEFRISSEQDKGFYMNPAYRLPKVPVAPGMPTSGELEVIEGMPVKSMITSHADGSHLRTGPVTLRGYAWAGEQKVARVEISTDGGIHWKQASLLGQDLPFAWRIWEIMWTPDRSGYFTILSRATDSMGRTQPFAPQWNPSGYLWNAIDQIGVTVENPA